MPKTSTPGRSQSQSPGKIPSQVSGGRDCAWAPPRPLPAPQGASQMQLMTDADWAILDFLSQDPRPIRDLLETYPKATIYHRLAVLRRRGLVAKHSSEYALTTAGQQLKTQREAETVSDALTEVYPPL